ncbi:GMP reductase 2, partial [Ophiophagus hannah]
MPHIDNDIKLDFKDVLLRPKRSTLKSRSENVAASTGTSDLEHLERVLEAVPQIRYICLDVANDFVMVGGMLAGHTESGGDLIEKEGKKYKLFYGMSSEVSMKKYAGGVAEYRASEGKVVEVPFKGDVEHTLRDILGGIRSTCTYVGAAKLKELSRRTTFIRVTQQVNPIFGGEDQP